MLLRRFGTFSGGIDLPDEKQATLDAPIVAPPGLRRLAVPLAPVSAPPGKPVVRAGDRVGPGQLLAKADHAGQVDAFAPLGGRVGRQVEAMLTDGRAGWRAAAALELVDLDEPAGIAGPPHRLDWKSAHGDATGDRIAQGQLLTCRTQVRPLAEWVADARRARADVLIANVMENTPFVTADHRLLAERGSEVVWGLAILARAVQPRQVILAVDGRRTDAYRAAVGPARRCRIESIALAHKYPIGADAILVDVLTRREVPPGGSPLDVRVAVTDAATCWAAYRWVACGQRQTHRVATVAGNQVPNAGNYFIPFGAYVAEVLAGAGAGEDRAAVYGPAMTGRLATDGAVVGADANALLAHPLPKAAATTPCIRCGWCGQNCPVRLNVAALNDDFELGRARRAMRRGALACVGCGICTYVCPARLPLAHRLALLKQAINERFGNPGNATSPKPSP